MKRFLSLFLLLVALRGFAASGDYIGAQIDPQGWQLWLEFASMGTNGSFNFGLATNNSIAGNQRVELQATSAGVTRTLFGTKNIRFAYPGNAFPDTSSNAVSTMVKVALSGYVYPADSNLTLRLSSGVYTNLTVNSAAVTAATVTNNSAQGAGIPIPKWSWPGWQRITGNTMTLRATGFQQSAQNGQPLASMTFIARGVTSGLGITNIQTQMVATREPVSGEVICEYVADMDISSLTAKENIRCDWIATPHSGPALTTLDNAYSWPTSKYSSITNLCDRTLTYSGAYGTWAVVATNGTDATGAISTNAPDPANPPAAFLTINGALLAIKGSNNAWFGHNDVGAGVVYLNQGNAWAWTGGSGSYSTVPDTWVEVTRWPSNAVTDVTMNSQSGLKVICQRDKLNGITLTMTNGTGALDLSTVWVDQCLLNSTSGVPIYRAWAFYTRNTVWDWKQHMRAQANTSSATMPVLIRGNLFLTTNTVVEMQFGTVLGNRLNYRAAGAAATSPFKSFFAYNQVCDDMQGGIVAFNSVYGWKGASLSILNLFTSTTTNGNNVAIVQNVFEQITGSASAALMTLAADGSAFQHTNVLVWNNTMVGQRVNLGYNDADPNPYWRVLFSVKNNFFVDYNTKSDTFVHGTYGASGNRVGNWAVIYGVGFSGNYFSEFNGATFHGPFMGMNTWWTNNTQAASSYAFVDFQAAENTNTGTGFGNYRFLSQSPALVRINTDYVLPYDFEGVRRGLFDPTGAYASARPRMGGGFF